MVFQFRGVLGDYQSVLNNAMYSHWGFTTLGLINQTQISLMVATKQTVNLLRRYDDEITRILESKRSADEVPPYKLLEKHGVVLYSGNHIGKQSGDIILNRLI